MVRISAELIDSNRMPFHIVLLLMGSTPVDASSTNITLGLPIIDIAQLSFLLLPPLRFPARVFVNSVKPKRAIVSLITLSIVVYRTPTKFAK